MTVSLAGCVARAPQQAPQAAFVAASPVNVIDLTQAELKLAERHAYERGFAAGRAWALRHPQSPPAPLDPVKLNESSAAPASPAPLSTPNPEAPAPTRALPKGPVYELSGPARPLSP